MTGNLAARALEACRRYALAQSALIALQQAKAWEKCPDAEAEYRAAHHTVLAIGREALEGEAIHPVLDVGPVSPALAEALRQRDEAVRLLEHALYYIGNTHDKEVRCSKCVEAHAFLARLGKP